MKIRNILALIFSFLLITVSCSDIQEELNSPAEIGIHEEGFGEVGSDNSHILHFQKENWNLKDCQQCHAADYSGGTAKFSCLTCHTDEAGPEACNTCHGDFSDSSRIAPPTDLAGNMERTERGVGAHTSHVYENMLGAGISCYECHPSATGSDEKYVFAHVGELPADMLFGTVASLNGNPTYDFDALTCQNTYCHGSFSFDKPTNYKDYAYTANQIVGKNSTVKWTEEYNSCDGCHGLPPTGHIYSELNQCYLCHADVVNSSGEIINKLNHLDGEKQSVAESELENCAKCHGSAQSDAPPVSLSGSSDPTDRGVGEHEKHLLTTSFTNLIECAECHTVPATYDAAGHFDGTQYAEVLFGTLAASDGANPQYSQSTLNCDNVYCHGGFEFEKPATYAAFAYSSDKISGNDPSLNWTSQAANAECGTCHGLPPTGHIYSELNQCYLCHADVVNASGEIISKDNHINAEKNVIAQNDLETCNYCHGDKNADPSVLANAAPPVALNGSSDPSYRGVGAHEIHVRTTEISNSADCAECHTVPATFDAPGHFDNSQYAEVNFGEIISVSQASSAAEFKSAGTTCANTYCHGGFKNGNMENIVNWTGGSEEAKCGTCHGDPDTGNPLPTGTHPQVQDCSRCHPSVVSVTDGQYSFVDKSKHIDGKVTIGGTTFDWTDLQLKKLKAGIDY